MTDEEKIEFYNRRLENVLQQHTRMLLDDKDMSKSAKKSHLDRVERMMKAGIEHIFTDDEMKRVEKEEMGYR